MVKRSKVQIPDPRVAAARPRVPAIAVLVWAIVEVAIVVLVGSLDWLGVGDLWIGLAAVGLSLLAFLLLFALKIADQWEKAVVLRFGRFRGLRGPGMFWIVPVVDRIPMWIDHRVMVTPFSAEKTLTKDTVPVDVDAVLFWLVWDAEKAALEVEDYRAAIAWSAQTALREVIGQMSLADILVGRALMDQDLQKVIDARTTPWGITVQSVEIRDIVIPQDLEDAMSRQAQAERERQARIILSESEAQIAGQFIQAGKAYESNPTALHLRAMNMLYEGLKERGALIVVPSTAVESMGLGTIAGLAAMRGVSVPQPPTPLPAAPPPTG